MEIKENTYKGTRILTGMDAFLKRDYINQCALYLYSLGYSELQIPIIQFTETFKGKVGEENNNLMYNFTDRGNRELSLAPEYTAVVQKLATTVFKYQTDVLLFYVGECFRAEKPQAGRYRQFTQLGIEVLNPVNYDIYDMVSLSNKLLKLRTIESEFLTEQSVRRGLDYYKEGLGFQISNDSLGSQKQIVGGGCYENGMGFAIGIDRLMLIK